MPPRFWTLSIPLTLITSTVSAQSLGPGAGATTVDRSNAGNATKVVIAAKRADVINKVDRKVYRADADLQAASGSAADILNNIPSVEVDIDGVLTLRGDASVTVLIDGKPSTQMQGAARGAALQGYSAGDIEQIEVITSPSAEFKPDGSGGIINIVTKKNRKQASSGQLLANLGNEGRHNASASGSYNNGGFELSGNLGQRKDTRQRTSDNESGATTPGAGITHSQQRQNETNTRDYVRAGLKYTPNERQTLGLTLDYASREERRVTADDTQPMGASVPASAYQRHGNGGGPRTDGTASLSFDQKLSGDGEQLSFYLQRGHTIETNQYDYQTNYAQPARAPVDAALLERDFSQQVYDLSKFTAAYVRPDRAGGTLKLGYDVEHGRDGFNDWMASASAPDAPLQVDHPFDNRFRYRQNVDAWYATYARKLAALEILGGLRYERVDIGTLQRVSGDGSAQHYNKLYPTLNALYALNDNDIVTAGYSKRVKKPDPEDLNPYVNAADPKSLRQGNPALRPQMTDALELGYRHEADVSYGLTAYYRKSRDGDTEILTPLAGDVVLITKANMPSTRSGGLEFSGTGKLLPRLGYNISGNASYNQINAQALGVAGTRSNFGFSGKGSLDYQFGAADRLQFGANYRGKRLTPQGYVMPMTVANFGYRRQLGDQLALVATVSDVFNGQRVRRVYETPGFSGTYLRQQAGRVAYLGFSYSLGRVKKAKDDFMFE